MWPELIAVIKASGHGSKRWYSLRISDVPIYASQDWKEIRAMASGMNRKFRDGSRPKNRNENWRRGWYWGEAILATRN